MQMTANKDLFTSKGLKNTKSRNLVYDILSKAEKPLTAEQVFLKLRETDAAVNLSTIYRTLELFVSKGMALKTNMAEENKAVFELNHDEHKHYVVCVGCKQMFPVDLCPLNEYKKILHDKTGFDITGHKFEIYGYCKKCQTDRQ